MVAAWLGVACMLVAVFGAEDANKFPVDLVGTEAQVVRTPCGQ